jgi:hypothetical protein
MSLSMEEPIAKKQSKWPEQIPVHIKKKLDEEGKDYSLNDVIDVCEEIISLYDDGINTTNTWEGEKVPELMMSTVTFRNKYKRYIK